MILHLIINMDIERILECLNLLGVKIHDDNQIKHRFLGVLEETSAKITKITQKLYLNENSVSVLEIECYERYISSLSHMLIKENTTTVLYFLQIILRRIKFSARNCMCVKNNKTYRKALILIEICKKLRKDLICNRLQFQREKVYWVTLYKILKYEDIFRLNLKSVN